MTAPEEKHVVIILVRGLPGSGKTYVARELSAALGSDTVMLDPDAVDTGSEAYQKHVAALTHEGVDPALHLYRFLRGQAYSGIAGGKTIVWNQPFTNLEVFQKMVANFQAQAEEHQVRLSILVVEVEADPAVAKERVETRKQEGGHGPSNETFARFTRDYTSFANEGFTTVTANGEGDVQQSVAKIQEALQQLD